jgi:hypothetical protein
MHKTLRYGIPALALGASLALAAPALAQHHSGNWTSGGGNGGGGPHGGSWAGGGSSSAPPAHSNNSGGGSSSSQWRPANSSGGTHGTHAHLFTGGQNYSHFTTTQRQSWSHGHWWHGHRGGHDGWWWFAGGSWFFYPYAVYPYPDYVSGTAYYGDEYDGQNWWYCPSPAGYYPYVQRCMVPWQAVPATPPQGYAPPDQGAPPPDVGAPPPDQGGPQNGPPPNGPDNGPPPDDAPPGY